MWRPELRRRQGDPDARLAEDLEADSLAAVELSMALEEEFGVTIADEELPNMRLWATW